MHKNTWKKTNPSSSVLNSKSSFYTDTKHNIEGKKIYIPVMMHGKS